MCIYLRVNKRCGGSGLVHKTITSTLTLSYLYHVMSNVCTFEVASLVARPCYFTMLDAIKITGTLKGWPGKYCTFFVFSKGICKYSMGFTLPCDIHN